MLITGDKLVLVQGSPKLLLQGLSQLGDAVHQDAGVQTDACLGHHLTGPVPVFRGMYTMIMPGTGSARCRR